MPMLRLLAVCSVVASVAVAQPTRPLLRDAAASLDDAGRAAFRAAPTCRDVVEPEARRLAAQLRANPRDSSGQLSRDVGRDVRALSRRASIERCPPPVFDALARAGELLQDARESAWGAPRHEHRRDRDDDDWDLASLQPLQVQLEASYDREPAVRVSVPRLELHHMDGETFYLGARFRSFEGDWTEWVTTQPWRVPSDPYVWRNAFQHFFRYSSLAQENVAQGRFVAQVAIFDGRGRELAAREVSFQVRLPTLPVEAPPTVRPRVDCGAGPDVGCTLLRDGRRPMDAATFTSYLRSLQSTANESARAMTARSMYGTQYTTALQYGLVLDLFFNEATRFQVAEAGAPRLVNPLDAEGYAQKFVNPGFQQNYLALLDAQRGGGHRPPHQQPPPQRRDCGTGPDDEGCFLQRGGHAPMDATTFNGLLASLQGTPNEFSRRDLALSVAGAGLTARQLGPVLDLFVNELIRLEVAKALAPAVVDPRHAIGWSTKFRNTFNAQEFVQVMTQQR